MNPRYTVSTMMNAFVAIFSFGIIFLTFDIRARDVQNRIRDVVDSLPATNIEIILGRLTGNVLLLLIPCLVFLGILACYELVTNLTGFYYRIGIQPMSVVSLIVWSLIPNLVFYGALVACLSTLVRFRILVAAIALAVLFGSLWVENQIPLRFQESLAQFLGSTSFPSDLAPVFVTPSVFGNKLAFLFVSVAFLLFASNLLPRTESQRKIYTITGIASAGIAAVTFFVLVSAVHRTENLQAEWATIHSQQPVSAFPDIQSLAGDIDLRPGRKITLDVSLTVVPPTENTTDSVIFSLNPGYKIRNLSVDNQEITDFSFDAGLLQIPTRFLKNESHEIRVQAHGTINDRFAYLDQARDFLKITHHSVPRLGLRSSIFHSDFVALMPGSFWYPISGSATGRDMLEHRARDVFTTDLKISVPNQWQVATVGKRETVVDQTRNTFQFQSHAPVPELALIASTFDHRETTIEGVNFEVLFSKKHSQILDVLSPLNDQIVHWVEERMKTVRALSLKYPYGAFYVVEVPSNLRIYGGGWRMESVLQPPGMMLIRETGLPTASFETRFRSIQQGESEEREEQYLGVFNALMRYFGNDEQGGSPFVGFSRNFVSHQVSAAQQGATVLQYVMDQLSNQLITGQESCSIISTAEFNEYVDNFLIGQTPDYHRSNWATKNRVEIGTLPSTWDVLNQTPLIVLDFDTNPLPSYRALLTKGFPLAQSMITHYGNAAVASLLEQLLNDFRGRNFTLEEFLSLASEFDREFHAWLLPWFEQTSLPGLLVEPPTVSNLETPELGETEYQTTFVLHNAEAMPGYARVVWSTEDEDQRLYTWGWGNFNYSDPILVAANASKRIAIQSANPPTGIWIEPFLSHNRGPIVVEVPEFNAETTQKSSALPFATDVEWSPPDTGAVIVDDLDPGFAIVSMKTDAGDAGRSVLRDTNLEEEMDNGLRVGGSILGTWSRGYNARSFGRYRHTHAAIAKAGGLSAARFRAKLPHSGEWKLEIFLPNELFNTIISATGNLVYVQGLGDQRSTNQSAGVELYQLEIKDGNTDHALTFDTANTKQGWNEVSKFKLNSTHVDVLLTDTPGLDHYAVFADAIRWTPVQSE